MQNRLARMQERSWMVHEWLGMIQERVGMIRNWFGRIPEGLPMIQDWFGMIQPLAVPASHAEDAVRRGTAADHLGTPRLVTDWNGAQIGTHTRWMLCSTVLLRNRA